MGVDKTPTAGKKYFQLPGLAETCIMWMDSFSQEGQGQRGGQRDSRSSLLRQQQVQTVITHWGFREDRYPSFRFSQRCNYSSGRGTILHLGHSALKQKAGKCLSHRRMEGDWGEKTKNPSSVINTGLCAPDLRHYRVAILANSFVLRDHSQRGCIIVKEGFSKNSRSIILTDSTVHSLICHCHSEHDPLWDIGIPKLVCVTVVDSPVVIPDSRVNHWLGGTLEGRTQKQTTVWSGFPLY